MLLPHIEQSLSGFRCFGVCVCVFVNLQHSGILPVVYSWGEHTSLCSSDAKAKQDVLCVYNADILPYGVQFSNSEILLCSSSKRGYLTEQISLFIC